MIENQILLQPCKAWANLKEKIVSPPLAVDKTLSEVLFTFKLLKLL